MQRQLSPRDFLHPSIRHLSVPSLSLSSTQTHTPHAHVSVWLAHLSYQTAPIWVGGEEREKRIGNERLERKRKRRRVGGLFLFVFFPSVFRTPAELRDCVLQSKRHQTFTSLLLSSEEKSRAKAEVGTCDCVIERLWLNVSKAIGVVYCYSVNDWHVHPGDLYVQSLYCFLHHLGTWVFYY